MNLRTTELEINPKDPFEHDPFGRLKFANKLNEIIKTSSGITVFIHDLIWDFEHLIELN